MGITRVSGAWYAAEPGSPGGPIRSYDARGSLPSWAGKLRSGPALPSLCPQTSPWHHPRWSWELRWRGAEMDARPLLLAPVCPSVCSDLDPAGEAPVAPG